MVLDGKREITRPFIMIGEILAHMRMLKPLYCLLQQYGPGFFGFIRTVIGVIDIQEVAQLAFER